MIVLQKVIEYIGTVAVGVFQSDVLGASLDSTDLNNLLQVVDPLSSQSAQDASSTIALDR